MNDDRVQYMIENLKQSQSDKHQFSIKHGFAYKRPQNFKDCIVIRWKHRRRKDKDFIDYERIKECADLCHEISEKYDLYDENHVFLEFDLRAIKVGVYAFFGWSYKIWAIPNEFKEIQEFIIPKLPAWAIVTRKK